MPRDELLPNFIPDKVSELEEYVLNAYGNPGQTQVWFEQALREVKRPKVLDEAMEKIPLLQRRIYLVRLMTCCRAIKIAERQTSRTSILIDVHCRFDTGWALVVI